jgi:hypothetical protein
MMTYSERLSALCTETNLTQAMQLSLQLKMKRYRLRRIGLAAGSHKLLKHKPLILVVHALARQRVNGRDEKMRYKLRIYDE